MVTGAGTFRFVGAVENKPILLWHWVSGTFPEPQRFCVGGKGQVHQRDAAVRDICKCKALVSRIFRVGKELFFFFSKEGMQKTIHR